MSGAPIQSGVIEFRVRYCECDPMGVAHHAAFPIWFEMGRTELYRAEGRSYRDLEAAGIFLAVVSITVRYHSPVRYDDVLTLETALTRATRAKLEHTYRITRAGIVVATGETALGCLDRTGRPAPLPDHLRSINGGTRD